MLTFVISAAIAIIVSFLCSLAEATLLSMNGIKIETDKAKGLKYALIFHRFRSNINKPISAILILNTIAHTGGATVAGSAFDEIFGDQWIWVFSVAFTVVILFGTEILPKVIGVANSAQLARYIARPLDLTVKVLYPLVAITELFNRLIIKKKKPTHRYSLEDLQTIASVAQLENIISKDQEEIIINTSRLKKRHVSEVMLPIDQVVFLPESVGAEEYFDVAEKYLHTRYPVSRSNSSQELFGYLNVKEIALRRDEIIADKLSQFIRPILFIAQDQSIIEVLKELTVKRYHLAIVKDGSGNNAGMITLEDLVEEIVGEIADEFDVQ